MGIGGGGAADIDGYGWRTLSEEKNLNCGTGSQKFLEDDGEMFMETFAGEKPGRRETISSLFFFLDDLCCSIYGSCDNGPQTSRSH